MFTYNKLLFKSQYLFHAILLDLLQFFIPGVCGFGGEQFESLSQSLIVLLYLRGFLRVRFPQIELLAELFKLAQFLLLLLPLLPQYLLDDCFQFFNFPASHYRLLQQFLHLFKTRLLVEILLDVDEVGTGAVATGAHEAQFGLCLLDPAEGADLLLLLRVELSYLFEFGVDFGLDHLHEFGEEGEEVGVDANEGGFFSLALIESDEEAVAEFSGEVEMVAHGGDAVQGDGFALSEQIADDVEDAAVVAAVDVGAPQLQQVEFTRQQLALLGAAEFLLLLHRLQTIWELPNISIGHGNSILVLEWMGCLNSYIIFMQRDLFANPLTFFHHNNHASLGKLQTKPTQVLKYSLPPRRQLSADLKEHSKPIAFRQKVKGREVSADKHSGEKSKEYSTAGKTMKEKKEILKPKQKTFKQPLRIERTKDFRTAIPREGFVEGRQKIEANYKEHGVIISCNGVLVEQREGWTFNSHQKFQSQLFSLEKMVRLEFFRNFFKTRSFNKWKRLTRHRNKHEIIKSLSLSIAFSPHNIAMVLKQQKILCKAQCRGFMTVRSEVESSAESLGEKLSTMVRKRLEEIKLGVFEEFCMQLIINLRGIIKEHEIFNNQEGSFRLSDHTFQDYFTRKHVYEHQTILRKFLFHYEEQKAQIILRLLQEIQSKIIYNISAWNSHFTAISLIDSLKLLFAENTTPDQLDPACFAHDLKMQLISVELKPGKPINTTEIAKHCTNSLNLLVDRVRGYLGQKYASYYSCGNELNNFLKTMLGRQLISLREGAIIRETLNNIDTYCFTDHYKIINEEVSYAVQQASELMFGNLAKVAVAARFIQSQFLSEVEKILAKPVQYSFDYCLLMEKLGQRVLRLPCQLKMGVFVLDLTVAVTELEAAIGERYEMVIGNCVRAFEDLIKQASKLIKRYSQSIEISSWSIGQFIRSYQSSYDYQSFLEGELRDRLLKLDSVLLTVHRAQPRAYQQAYLDLFHLREAAESTKTRANCFLRECLNKVAYLSAEKHTRTALISAEIEKAQLKMQQIAIIERIEFVEVYAWLKDVESQLKVQAGEIQELISFMEIEKSLSARDSGGLQFLGHDKLTNEVGCLLKLLGSYNEFWEAVQEELKRQYCSFRLELLMQRLHDQVARIKQSSRLLHNYQKFLLAVSALYQTENLKIRQLRLVMQLTLQDLQRMDKQHFSPEERYSAQHMLLYLAAHQSAVRQFIEEKQFTDRLRQKIVLIQDRLGQFILVSDAEKHLPLPANLSSFLQNLQRNEAELEGYLRNESLRQLKTQIVDFLSLLRKSIRFLTDYSAIGELFASYIEYLKQGGVWRDEGRQASEIADKWGELNRDMRNCSLKHIVEILHEAQMERMSVVNQNVRLQLAKINAFIARKAEEFPLYHFVPQSCLLALIHNPLRFLEHFHPTATHARLQLDESQRGQLVLSTIYGERVGFAVEGSIDVGWMMGEIASSLRNTVSNLQGCSFQQFLQVVESQSVPLQAVFVADQLSLKQLFTLKNPSETAALLQKQIQLLIAFYRTHDRPSVYKRLLIDCLLLSKLQSRNLFNSQITSEFPDLPHYRRNQEDLLLQVGAKSLRVDCHLVDPIHLAAIQPLTLRTWLKLLQGLLQTRGMLLYSSHGLQNVACRLMRHFLPIKEHLPIDKVLAAATRQSLVLYIPSKEQQTAGEFFSKVRFTFQSITRCIEEREKRYRGRMGSSKQLFSYKLSVSLEIPLSCYRMEQRYDMNYFNGVYRELPAQIRVNFRIVEFFQPAVCLLLKLSILKEGLISNDDLQHEIMIEFVRYKQKIMNKGQFLTNRDISLLFQQIIKTLSRYEKPQPEHIKAVYSGLDYGEQLKRTERSKSALFRERGSNAQNRKDSQSLIRWEETQLHSEFLRFSRQLDEQLLNPQTLLVIGKTCSGKSHMIRLYVELVNAQQRSDHIKGKKTGKTLLLHGIDLSMLPYDSKYVQKQIETLQTQPQSLSLLWLDGIDQSSPRSIEELLEKPWMTGHGGECHMIAQVSEPANLSPRVLLGVGKIVVRERSFSFVEIVHARRQEVGQLLNGSCLSRVFDAFGVFPRLLKSLFNTMRQQFMRLYAIPCEDELAVIHSFDLLAGILRLKSPKIVEQLQSIGQHQKNQLLRRLFVFCLLSITVPILEQPIARRFEDVLLELGRKEGIDTAGIGSNFILNPQSDGIDYLPIKNARNTMLPVTEGNFHGELFIETHQTLILRNFLQCLTSNSQSRLILTGDYQSGKTALLQDFVHRSHSHHLCSLLSYGSVIELARSLRENNSTYERQKVQQALRDDGGVRWYLALSRSRCVYVQSVALDMWPRALTYFKHLTQQTAGSTWFRQVHLLLERSPKMQRQASEMHFLPVKVGYEQGYMGEVMNGIYQVAVRSSLIQHQACYETLKVKGVVVKHLLGFFKLMAKKVPQSVPNWHHYFPLSTLKTAFLSAGNCSLTSKSQFLQALLSAVEWQVGPRIGEGTAHVVFSKLFANCRQHIRQDLKQELLVEVVLPEGKEQEAIAKLTNYLEYKNQFRGLHRSKILIHNLTKFLHAMGHRKLIVLNKCLISGVGEFLPIAADILNLQILQVSSLQQLRLLTSQGEAVLSGRPTDTILYHIPSWMLSDRQVMAFLCNRMREGESCTKRRSNGGEAERRGSSTEGRGISLDAIGGRTYFVVQYSQALERSELNLLRYEEIMKGGSFARIEWGGHRDEQSQINQVVGKERTQLQVKEDQTLTMKVKRIYELLLGEQLLKKVDSRIFRYAFSTQNYCRFVRGVVDTYFERKYQILANVQQLDLALLHLDSYLQEFLEIRQANQKLRLAQAQAKERVASVAEFQRGIREALQQLASCEQYQQLQTRRKVTSEFDLARQQMAAKEQSLIEQIETHKNIPRAEIANLKSLWANSQSGKPLFQCLALLISGQSEPAAVKKTMLDINLSLRIKQLNFWDKGEELMQAIRERLADAGEHQESLVSQNLYTWLTHSVQYYFFRKQQNTFLQTCQKHRLLTSNDSEAQAIEANLHKLTIEVEEAKQKLEKERQVVRELDHQLKQSDQLIRGLQKFTLVEALRKSCRDKRELLDRQLQLCLESSIYFSLKLSFIFPCDLGAGWTVQLNKSKEKFESYRGVIERTFIKWVGQNNREANLAFFKSEMHRIFENKQKYEFIDKELESEEWDVITKCKKIGQLCNKAQIVRTSTTSSSIYLPNIIFNKLLYLKYLLAVRFGSTKVLLLDPHCNLHKYLQLTHAHRLPLKRNHLRHQLPPTTDPPLIAHLLRANESSVLTIVHNVLFIEIPSSAGQVVLKEGRKDGANGLTLRINSQQYLIPSLDKLKLVFTVKELLKDEAVMGQFYLINFEQNSMDAMELISSEVLRFQLNQIIGSHSLLPVLKSASSAVVNDTQVKKLVLSDQKWRFINELQSLQKQLQFDVIEKCCLVSSKQKLKTINGIFFTKMIAMIEEWRAVSLESQQSQANLAALSEHSDQYNKPFCNRMLQLYRVCCCANRRLQRSLVSCNNERPHHSFSFLLKQIKQGLRFCLDRLGSAPLLEHLELLQKYVLNQICNFSQQKDVFTLGLYLKIYSAPSQATDYQILNLLHSIDPELQLETVIEHKVDNWPQAAHQQLPLYKLEIQRFLKSLKQLRSKENAGQMKGKNLFIGDNHIQELIENFEFKVMATDREQGECFRKLSLFTQLLLLKMLVPDLFLKKAMALAQKWRTDFIQEEELSSQMKEFYLRGVCVHFCENHWMGQWLSRHPLLQVEVIRVQDLGKIEDKLKTSHSNNLRVILDERDYPVQEKNEGFIRQRLQEYIALPRGRIIVLANYRYHQLFHELLRAEAIRFPLDSEQFCPVLSIHCLGRHLFFPLLKSAANQSETATCPTLSGIYCELQRQLIEPILNEIAIDRGCPLNHHSRWQQLYIWEQFGTLDVEHVERLGDVQGVGGKKYFPSELCSLFEQQEMEVGIERVYKIMGCLQRNRSAILAYLRNKLHKYRQATVSNSKSKPNIQAEEIECRFTGSTDEPPSKPSVRRLSRSRSFKMKATVTRLLHEEYQVEAWLQLRTTMVVQQTEQALEELVNLWKVYEGQLSLAANYHSLLTLPTSLPRFVVSRLSLITRCLQEFEQLLLMRESKKAEMVLDYSQLGGYLEGVRGSGLGGLFWGESNRRQEWMGVRCYDSERCDNCSLLGKRRSNEKICILINSHLFEITTAPPTPELPPPYIVLRVGCDSLLARVYCRRVASQLL